MGDVLTSSCRMVVLPERSIFICLFIISEALVLAVSMAL